MNRSNSAHSEPLWTLAQPPALLLLLAKVVITPWSMSDSYSSGGYIRGSSGQCGCSSGTAELPNSSPSKSINCGISESAQEFVTSLISSADNPTWSDLVSLRKRMMCMSLVHSSVLSTFSKEYNGYKQLLGHPLYLLWEFPGPVCEPQSQHWCQCLITVPCYYSLFVPTVSLFQDSKMNSKMNSSTTLSIRYHSKH